MRLIVRFKIYMTLKYILYKYLACAFDVLCVNDNMFLPIELALYYNTNK